MPYVSWDGKCASNMLQQVCTFPVTEREYHINLFPISTFSLCNFFFLSFFLWLYIHQKKLKMSLLHVHKWKWKLYFWRAAATCYPMNASRDVVACDRDISAFFEFELICGLLGRWTCLHLSWCTARSDRQEASRLFRLVVRSNRPEKEITQETLQVTK